MKIIIITGIMFLLFSCVEKDKTVTIVLPSTPDGENASTEITIQSIPGGIATRGIFDPSIEYESSASKLWMSYSSVDLSPLWPSVLIPGVVSIRLASSGDNGSTWTDYGAINPFTEINPASAAPEPNVPGTYCNEVSTIVYDGKDGTKPWKIIWFKYYIQSTDGSKPATHMSINIKSASTPENLGGATEQNLFAGSLFAGTTNGIIQLNTLHADLNKCVAFTEPGAIATESALYVTLGCLHALGKKQDTILLKFSGDSTNIQNSANWSYIGTLLESDDASSINPLYKRFTGSEIEKIGNDYYLFVSPGQDVPVPVFYNGCLIYKIPNLDIPTVNYHSALSVTHGTNDFHGVCTYNSNSTNSGIIYSYTNAGVNAFFQIFASGDTL